MQRRETEISKHVTQLKGQKRDEDMQSAKPDADMQAAKMEICKRQGEIDMQAVEREHARSKARLKCAYIVTSINGYVGGVISINGYVESQYMVMGGRSLYMVMWEVFFCIPF